MVPLPSCGSNRVYLLVCRNHLSRRPQNTLQLSTFPGAPVLDSVIPAPQQNSHHDISCGCWQESIHENLDGGGGGSLEPSQRFQPFVYNFALIATGGRRGGSAGGGGGARVYNWGRQGERGESCYPCWVQTFQNGSFGESPTLLPPVTYAL